LIGIAYAAVAACVLRASTTEPWAIAVYPQLPRVLVFGPAAVLIVYGFVSLEGRLKCPRGLVAVGDASYSLYLLHTIPLMGAFVLGFSVPHSRLPHLLWLAATLASCLALGLLAHRFVEKPLLSLIRVKKPKGASAEEPLRMAA
jgi:exopolysaccharide production protein ExoZ